MSVPLRRIFPTPTSPSTTSALPCVPKRRGCSMSTPADPSLLPRHRQSSRYSRFHPLWLERCPAGPLFGPSGAARAPTPSQFTLTGRCGHRLPSSAQSSAGQAPRQANCLVPILRRALPCPVHDPILSRSGASGKPGAVHAGDADGVSLGESPVGSPTRLLAYTLRRYKSCAPLGPRGIVHRSDRVCQCRHIRMDGGVVAAFDPSLAR